MQAHEMIDNQEDQKASISYVKRLAEWKTVILLQAILLGGAGIVTIALTGTTSAIVCAVMIPPCYPVSISPPLHRYFSSK